MATQIPSIKEGDASKLQQIIGKRMIKEGKIERNFAVEENKLMKSINFLF